MTLETIGHELAKLASLRTRFDQLYEKIEPQIRRKKVDTNLLNQLVGTSKQISDTSAAIQAGLPAYLAKNIPDQAAENTQGQAVLDNLNTANTALNALNGTINPTPAQAPADPNATTTTTVQGQ